MNMSWLVQVFSRVVPNYLNPTSADIYSNGEKIDAESKTLFIVAGPCGSGKSSIIRTAYQLDLQLFGEEFHSAFRQANLDLSGEEYDDYSTALSNNSFYQASHVKLLSREPVLPPCVLLHLDLYQILRGIDRSYWPHKLKKRYLRSSFNRMSSTKLIKRSFEDLMSKNDNDLMMKAFLSKKVFRRFRNIAVVTVECNFRKNSEQLALRKSCSGGQWMKYFSAPEGVAKAIHNELYRCWFKGIKSLDPIRLSRIVINDSDELCLDGRVVVSGWSQLLNVSTNAVLQPAAIDPTIADGDAS
jgi:hypothetical protein